MSLEVVLAEAGPTDVPAARLGLEVLHTELTRQDTVLRGAAAWPLTLALSLTLASLVVVGVGLPALAGLPGAGGARWPLAGVVVSIILLVGLANGAWWRIPGRARTALAMLAAVEGARVLVHAGADLPRALRATAPWAGPSVRDLARALESGEVSPPSVARAQARSPLGPFETRMLLAAAGAGQAEPALEALVAAGRARVDRLVPREAARVHLVGVILAAMGVLSLGAAWFSAYSAGVGR